MASITLVELIALKAMMKSMKTKATSRCIRLRSFTSSFLPRISTQRLVVIAVNAESALEKLAATIPMVNSTTTRVPITPEAANIGNRSSGAAAALRPASVQHHQQHTQTQEKQIGRHKGETIGTDILLSLAKRLAGKILLHHILI